MEHYLTLIRQTVPTFSKEDLEISPRAAGFDSIDLVVIRVAFEKYIGKEIPNSEWSNFRTIREVIDYCIINEKKDLNQSANSSTITTTRSYEINMPQMANSALSESWLFKELGDVHWGLLSKGLNTKSSEIKDETGNRLYPTFTRIQISTLPLFVYRENDHLRLEASIKRFGLSTYVSEMTFEIDSNNSRATLMTSFSTRESIDNSKLFKNQPFIIKNQIPEYTSAPEILNDYRLLRKNLIETIRTNDHEFNLSVSPIHEVIYTLNPFYEINGVGLLYFAAYPIISDKCEADYFNDSGYKRWESNFYTIQRDIFYFANCNIDDSILFRLNSAEFISNNLVKVFSSLYRKRDMTLMAHVFTIKTKK
jgi:probable biosynthetic protein (TIGR04098 family)